ncbi:S-layer homology domain-containing protein [Bacillus tianshenii]|nr:S-layer homology domain-containing protein [Bacillus tianshenii]
MARKLSAFFIALTLVMSVLGVETALASPLSYKVSESKTKVSPGVAHVESIYKGDNLRNSVHMLDVNLADPTTTLEVGVPTPFNSLKRVTDQAKANSLDGHHVVGATNAGFFDPKTKLPISLFVKDNKVYNFGLNGLSTDSPLNSQVAFGVNQAGKAKIEHFKYSIHMETDDVDVTTHRINEPRNEEEMVVFTRPYKRSWANHWGTEFVLTNLEPKLEDIEAGQPVTATVSNLTGIGDYPSSAVPEDGLIVSAHGKEWAEKLKGLENGDEMTITFNLNPTWQDAKYVIGTGPLLVDNGQVSISMNQGDYFASGRAPRTAIAVDKSGERVFVVTVDGRQSGYSDGVNMRDLAQYLISQGAYRAINLDGGGSTAMAVRELGQFVPTLQNRPSDGFERSVSTTLLAVSNTRTGEAKQMKLSKQEGKVFIGTRLPVHVKYALDQYLNPVSVNEGNIAWSTSNDQVGEMDGDTFVAKKAGQATITANYQSSTAQVPVTVVDRFKELKVSPQSLRIGTSQTATFTAKPLTDDGDPIIFDNSAVKWRVEGNIGTISSNGVFTANSTVGEGKVIATAGAMSVSVPVKVGLEPEVFEHFNSISNWSSASARANTEITGSKAPSPVYEGSGALRIKYDFTTKEEGIKASYAVAKNKITIPGKPLELGAWVYGDGGGHWLRAKIIDGTGKEHTISFTEEGEFDWKGWKYVTAKLPSGFAAPIKFDRIYVAEAIADNQNSGTVYVDKLQAVYNPNHTEPRFKDMTSKHWAYGAIVELTDDSIITGFPDATFKPEASLTRAQAAIMIARDLSLPLSSVADPGFKDLERDHYAYRAVAAVAEEGIIRGMTEETFAPDEPLTRAQMAAILKRAYELSGTGNKAFNDLNKTHWAYEAIQTLAENDITGGYPDGSYRPEKATTRAEFAAFLIRVTK